MKPTAYSLAALLPLVLPGQADDLWVQVSCFTSIGNMESMGTYEFQSIGHCTTQCEEVKGVFAAVQEELCYCGNATLDIQDMALADDDSACNAACPGYAVDTCGGEGVYSLWVSQEYALSLNDDDDDDADDDDGNGNYGNDYGDEDSDMDGDENEDGEDSNNDSYSGWNNTSTAVTTTTASTTTAINAVPTSSSVGGRTSSTTAAANQTATGSAAITTTTSTSGARRRFRILFF